jgi:hypothetical protein
MMARQVVMDDVSNLVLRKAKCVGESSCESNFYLLLL